MVLIPPTALETALRARNIGLPADISLRIQLLWAQSIAKTFHTLEKIEIVNHLLIVKLICHIGWLVKDTITVTVPLS